MVCVLILIFTSTKENLELNSVESAFSLNLKNFLGLDRCNSDHFHVWCIIGGCN